jgi:spermidine synthase
MFDLIALLFFFSGFTALIYQMVWMRELVLVFGASMFAISTLLTAFMGGLTLGSWYFGKRADRFSNPLSVYGLLELGIGAYAFLVPFLFSSLIPLYQFLSNLFGFSFYAFSLVRFVLAVLILLLPTALMGGTLPVLAELYKNKETVGRGVGLLYAFNTLGAVMGVLGAGFLLLPMLGLQKTVFLSAGLNGMISLAAFSMGKKGSIQHPPPQNAATADPKPPLQAAGTLKQELLQRRVLLIVFALSGFSAMIYEVVWTRILTLILGSTVYSYATMLSTFLLGLAIGSFIFSLLLKRFAHPLLLLAMVQGGIALFSFTGELFFPVLPILFSKFMELFHSWSSIRSIAKFIISGAVMLIPTLLMGGVFPLVIHLLTSKEIPRKKTSELNPPSRLGAIVGRAYAINTIGTIAGSFAVGFIFLPLLGIQKSLHVAILTNTVLSLSLWVLLSEMGEVRRWAAGGVVAFFLMVTFSTPVWNPLSMSSELFGKLSTLNLLFYKEGISSTVTVVQHPTLSKLPHLTLAIDGKANASTTGDMKTQILVGHLPMLLAPEAKEVISIGHGSGITTGAIATHPLTKLVTLEIEPAVVEASRYFDSFNGKVLEDPRVKMVEDDARNYLLRSAERFDVIVSEPSHPWRSGSSKLFTQEFFKIGKAHLQPGGVFTQWIHFYGIRPPELKSVIHTFHTVFPQVLIFYTEAGDLILLGSEKPFSLDRMEIAKRMEEHSVKLDLARVNVYSPFDLWSYFLLGPNEIERYTGKATLNTDDYTLVEFQTPKSLFEDTMSIHIAEMKGAARAGKHYLIGTEEPPTAQAEAFYSLAKGYFRADKDEDALEMIEKGLQFHPAAEGEWLRGLYFQKKGNRQAAERAWLDALQKESAYPEALLSLAKFYQEQGAFKKAEPFLSRLRKENPEKIEAAYYHGVNLYYKGKYQEAVEELRLGIFFSEPFGHYYQSLVYGKLNQEKEAKEALGEFILSLNIWRKDLETDPKKFSTLPYLKLVEWRRRIGIQIPEEERMAELFEQVVSRSLNHLYSGAGLFILGYFKEAADELQKGVQQLGNQSSESIAHYYLGLAYKESGRMIEAGQELEIFIKHGSLDSKDSRIDLAKKILSQIQVSRKSVS